MTVCTTRKTRPAALADRIDVSAPSPRNMSFATLIALLAITNSQTIPIPERWRQVISQFEGALLAPASHSGS